MGPKRRSKRNRIPANTGSSSSDDSEHQKTQDVINRLSQKYLRSSIRSDTEQKKISSFPKQTGKKVSHEEKEHFGYDGDIESSTEHTSPSDVSMTSPAHNSGPSDVDEVLKLVLSPKKSNMRISKSNKTQTKSQMSLRKRSSKENWSASDESSKNIKSQKKTDIVLRKRPVRETGSATEEPTKKLKTVVSRAGAGIRGKASGKSRPGLSLNDSGIMSSSFSPVPVKPLFPTMDTSTPNAPVKLQKDSSFGISSFTNSSIMLSPVQKVLSPTSDYQSMITRGSLETMELSASPQLKTYERTPAFTGTNDLRLGFDDILVADKPAKKKHRPKPKPKVQLDEWLDKINTEFDEIEMFELSIEG